LVPFDRLHAEERYPRRRQTFSKVYVRTAGLYVTRPEIVLGGSLWGDTILPHLVPRERAVNINDEFDFKVAEMLLKECL
jgi:N-acylneuraminate cytidylyltransferase